MPRLSATLKLLFLCAAAATTLFLVERSQRARRISAEAAGPARILDGVESFSVALSNGETRVFHRADGTWRILEPVPAPADDARVMALLDAFGRIERRTHISSREASLRALSAHDFGLDAPAATVEFQFFHAAPLTVAFGARPPAATNEVFASIGGEDGVSVLGTRILDSLGMPLEEFSDRRLCTAPLRDVTRISVERSGREALRLKRAPERDGWRITAPEALPADFGRMKDFLDALGQARISSFLYGADASAAAEPVATIKLYTDTSPFPSVLSLCGEIQGTGLSAAVSDAGSPVAIPTETARALALTPGSIRDRRVFPSGLALNLHRLTVSTDDGRRLVVDRSEGGDWRVVEPFPAAADQEAVARIVDEILSLEASDYVPSAGLVGEPAATPPPAERIAVEIAADTATNGIVCAFAAQKEEGAAAEVAVTLDDSDLSAIEPAAALATLRAIAGDHALAYARLIGEYPIREVLSIDVTRANGTSQRFDVAPDGSMSIGGDDGAQEPVSDPEAISALVSGMVRFLARIEADAVAFPAPGADAREGVPSGVDGETAVTVAIEPRNPQRPTLTLAIAAPDADAGTVNVRTGADAPVYVFPSSIYEYFARNFRESYHAAELAQ